MSKLQTHPRYQLTHLGTQDHRLLKLRNLHEHTPEYWYSVIVKNMYSVLGELRSIFYVYQHSSICISPAHIVADLSFSSHEIVGVNQLANSQVLVPPPAPLPLAYS